jgi:hypothetical protein
VGTSPEGPPQKELPEEQAPVPLAAELGLGQDVGGQCVRGGLQEKPMLGEGLEPGHAHCCKEGSLTGLGWPSTHQVLHGHPAAIAQLLADRGRGVLSVEAELDLCLVSQAQ